MKPKSKNIIILSVCAIVLLLVCDLVYPLLNWRYVPIVNKAYRIISGAPNIHERGMERVYVGVEKEVAPNEFTKANKSDEGIQVYVISNPPSYEFVQVKNDPTHYYKYSVRFW